MLIEIKGKTFATAAAEMVAIADQAHSNTPLPFIFQNGAGDKNLAHDHTFTFCYHLRRLYM